MGHVDISHVLRSLKSLHVAKSMLAASAGAVGGAGDAPPSAATVVVPDRFTRAGLPVDAALVQSVAYFSGGFSA